MGIFDDGYQQANHPRGMATGTADGDQQTIERLLHLGIAAGRPRTGHLFVIYAGLIVKISILLRQAREAAAEKSH